MPILDDVDCEVIIVVDTPNEADTTIQGGGGGGVVWKILYRS